MSEKEIAAYAMRIVEQFGATADLEALRRAQTFDNAGDRLNADLWLEITDTVRKLQNLHHIRRDGI
jgi:hypothetical protein